MKKSISTLFSTLCLVAFCFFAPSSINKVYSQAACCCSCGCAPFTGDCTTACFNLCFDFLGGTEEADAACAGSPCGPVPIELNYFELYLMDNNKVEITWETISESNNRGFEIQRASGIKLDWETIGFVEGQGTTIDAQEYVFLDQNPLPGTNYYRLNQLDFDETSTYSDTKAVYPSAKKSVEIWPTLAKTKVFIQLEGDLNFEDYQIEVFDMIGRQVMTQASGEGHIDIDQLEKGHYIINIHIKGKMYSERFVKAE